MSGKRMKRYGMILIICLLLSITETPEAGEWGGFDIEVMPGEEDTVGEENTDNPEENIQDDSSEEDQSEGNVYEEEILEEPETEPVQQETTEPVRREQEPERHEEIKAEKTQPPSAEEKIGKENEESSQEKRESIKSSPSVQIKKEESKKADSKQQKRNTIETVTPKPVFSATPTPAVHRAFPTASEPKENRIHSHEEISLQYYQAVGQIKENKKCDEQTVLFLHEKACKEKERPRITLQSEYDILVLSLRVNERECEWSWQGDSIVIEEPVKKGKYKIELTVAVDGRKIIRMTPWSF